MNNDLNDSIRLAMLEDELSKLKDYTDDLETTITDLNSVIQNLISEKEELQKQIQYWKNSHDTVKEDYDMYNNIMFNGYL